MDGEPLLSRAELSRGRLLEDPGGISFTAQSRFLELAAIEANDTLLGLHVAAEMDLRDAGILFYLAASSATVKDALDYLVRYAGAASEAIRLDISRQNGETVLTACPVLAFDEPHRRVGGPQSAAKGDQPRLRTPTGHLCTRAGFWVKGDPPHPAMSGRIRADQRQLGIP